MQVRADDCRRSRRKKQTTSASVLIGIPFHKKKSPSDNNFTLFISFVSFY